MLTSGWTGLAGSGDLAQSALVPAYPYPDETDFIGMTLRNVEADLIVRDYCHFGPGCS